MGQAIIMRIILVQEVEISGIALHLWVVFQRMGMVYMTWRVMCGSGAMTGMAVITMVPVPLLTRGARRVASTVRSAAVRGSTMRTAYAAPTGTASTPRRTRTTT